jgi:hypothetical protein
MAGKDVLLEDVPYCEMGVLKLVALGTCILLSPVLVVVYMFDPQQLTTALAVWILAPLLIVGAPHLLFPTRLLVLDTELLVKSGIWNMHIRYPTLTDLDVVDYPPAREKNEYAFPGAQWVKITRAEGFFKTWYVPTTSAELLVSTIRSRWKKEVGED